MLVIDDFGRQQVAPRDLLNRWIVPLESRVDFLTLQSGQKFELPFMVLVIFATNIKPADLVDEAFLRRIHYKVFAESPTVAEFMQIFENCCREREVAVRSRRSSSTAQDLLRAAEDPAARLPAARPDRPGAVAGRVSRRAAGADAASCSKRRAPAISSTNGKSRSSIRRRWTRSVRSRRARSCRRRSWSLALVPAACRSAPSGPTAVGPNHVAARPARRPWHRPHRRADPGGAGSRAVAGAVLRGRQAAVVGRRVGRRMRSEWVDENPFEPREIAVAVADSLGNTARDTVLLKPLEVTEVTE